MNSFFKSFSIFLISLFFLGMLIFTFFFYFTKIETVELKVDPELKDSYFTEKVKNKIVLKLKNYKGQKIWKVNLEDISFDVKKIYPALSIQVVRKIPNHISVFLKVKNSAALLLKDSGILHSISFQGELQARLETHQFLDLPILRGKSFQNNQNLRKKAIRLLAELPEKGLLSSYNVSEVVYNKKNSSFLLILISNNFTIELISNLSPKRLKNINFVLNYLVQKDIKRSRVDARFNKKIIVNTHNSL